MFEKLDWGVDVTNESCSHGGLWDEILRNINKYNVVWKCSDFLDSDARIKITEFPNEHLFVSWIFSIESFMEEIQALVKEKKKIEEMSQLNQKALHDYFGLSIF